MKRSIRTALSCLAGALVPWSLQAQDSLETGLAACAELPDDDLRLDCFDGLASLAAENPEEAPAVAGTTGARTFPVGEQPADAPPPERPDPPAAAARADPAEDQDLFGLETRTAQDIDRIQSRYDGHFEGWSGDTLFYLQNGQVWRQTERGSLSWSAENPMITIERGVFGTFRLSVEGLNSSVRVERVE